MRVRGEHAWETLCRCEVSWPQAGSGEGRRHQGHARPTHSPKSRQWPLEKRRGSLWSWTPPPAMGADGICPLHGHGGPVPTSLTPHQDAPSEAWGRPRDTESGPEVPPCLTSPHAIPSKVAPLSETHFLPGLPSSLGPKSWETEGHGTMLPCEPACATITLRRGFS